MLGKIHKRKKQIMVVFIGLLFINIVLFLSVTIKADELKCDPEVAKLLDSSDYDKFDKICAEEIENLNNDLKKKEDETSGIKSFVKQLDSNIKISQFYINKKMAKANRLKQDISVTIEDIRNLNEDFDNINVSLGKLIFERNQVEANTVVEKLLSTKTLSEFFEDIEVSSFIEKKISQQIKKIKIETEELRRFNIELEERESVERQLALEEANEREKIKKNKKEKQRLLGILKKEEGDIKTEIESRIKVKKAILAKKFSVASGEKVTFGEAYNIIKPYQKELGMDSAFVLAILFQESGYRGKIGGNIGRCFYNQKTKGVQTVMRNSQKASFLKIMTGLNIDPNSQKVSCPISKDGAYGGAMGPAQFMPNTWIGIRKLSAEIIDKNYKDMSPFINSDAFISSAVLLKQNYYSKSCSDYSKKYRHISSDRTLRERCAAARYYAGGNWWRFRMGYGESVVKRANSFREDIKTLNS